VGTERHESRRIDNQVLFSFPHFLVGSKEEDMGLE
jgi:hypothetical protein